MNVRELFASILVRPPINKIVMGIACGVAVSACIALGFYFKKKRPNFKEELLKQMEVEIALQPNEDGMPDTVDSDDLQQCFMQLLEQGEQALAAEDFDRAVEHFLNATLICKQPSQLLNILNQIMPSEAYDILNKRYVAITSIWPVPMPTEDSSTMVFSA